MGQADYKQLRLSKMQLISKLKLMNIFPGDWESIYKGEGIEFDSTRPFEPGDNPKDIDLFTMAQSGEEDIILRAEERQMKIYIWVDLSGSMENFNEMFFPSKPDIKDIATGLIAYSTCNIYTPLGLCAFDDDIRCFFPARAGADHCDEIINWIIEHNCKAIKVSADIEKALSFLTERAYSQNMIFFISDFQGQIFEENFTNLIKSVVEKFDFIPVIIRDPLENKASIKKPISIVVENSEGDGEQRFILLLINCGKSRKYRKIIL
jgi:uncharacterized protein (DUF58 family)